MQVADRTSQPEICSLRAFIWPLALCILQFAAPWFALAQEGEKHQVFAARLDGAALTGELQSWSNERVLIAATAGPQMIPVEQLLSLRWQPGPPPAPPQDAKLPVVELVDGSILPIDGFRSAGGDVKLALRGGNGPRELSMLARQVASVRLQSLAPAVAAQWDEIRAKNLPSDVLIILKRDGQSLDYVEGVLGAVSDDKIEFRMDGEPLPVDRARAAGLIYFRRDRASAAAPRCIVNSRSGLRASAQTASLDNDMIRVKLQAGPEFNWPLSDVYLADFSAGKIAYLSDLEAASQKWTPLVGLPAVAAAAARRGEPRRDQSGFGGPLKLLMADDASQSARERTFSKGLAVRSRTELAYRLPDGFRKFAALAGIDPAVRSVGNVRLTIRGDDKVLYDAEITGGQAPTALDLDLARARRLTIIVDYGRNLDTGDWLNLCDARLVK